jgi:DNA-binding transcriptional LysR family regulator
MLIVMWERELELKHLVALQAVAAERSFGRAAERLGYTQSAISQQIAALERVVGEPVFDRPGGPRPVELTPCGQVILDHAEQVFRRLAQAEEEVARLKAGDGGRLVIGTFQSVSVKVLPDVIRVLKAERPQLDIGLFEADDHDVIVQRVLEGELDLGFVVGEGFDERLEQVHLLDDPYLLISPRSDRPLPATFATADLSGGPLVGEAVSSCQAAIDRGLRSAGVEPTYVFRSNDNGAVQAMVRVGMGRAVLPVLAFDASDPDVVAQELDPPIPPRRISLIRRRARTLPPAADRFVEIASQVCADLGAAGHPVPAAS